MALNHRFDACRWIDTREVNVAHVLVIGASKGIGLETVKAALKAGHRVRAFARSAADIALSDPGLERFTGNALDSADIAAALEGIDVVVQALGVPASKLLGPSACFRKRRTGWCRRWRRWVCAASSP